MQDTETILADPKFQGLPANERIKVLDTVDPRFKGLPSAEKLKVVTSPRLSKSGPSAAPKPLIPADAGLRGPLTLSERTRNLARDIVPNLPMLGTAIGGMTGGIPGAALGAGAGAFLRKATETDLGGGGGIDYTTTKKDELIPAGIKETGEEVLSKSAQGAALEAGFKLVGNLLAPAFKPAATAVKSEIDDLSSLIRTKGTAPQPTALQSQPFLKQSAQELMYDPSRLAIGRPAVGSADAFGDVYRGGTDAQAQAVAQRAGIPYNPADPTPIPLMIADHAVDIAERPLNAFVGHFAKESVPEVKQAIVSDLTNSMNSTIDDALKANYRNLIRHVQEAPDTVEAINNLKVYANKESARIYRASPQAAIQATVQPIQAYKDLGDSVRGNLYPRLQSLGAPDLSEFGRREAQVISARDGIRDSWTKAVTQQIADDRQSYLNWVTQGHSDTFRFAVSERSAATVSMIGRALKGKPNPLSDFNKAFSGGVGDIRGFEPTHVLYDKAKLAKMIGPNRPSSALGSKLTVQRGTIADLINAPSRLGGVEYRPSRLLTPGRAELTAGTPSQRLMTAGTAQEARSIPLPGRPTRLNYGLGRESDLLQNWQYTGETTPSVLSRPEGPGTLSADPKTIRSTIESIDRQIRENPKSPDIAKLKVIRRDLIRRLGRK